MLYTVVGIVIPWLLVGLALWLLYELVRLSGRVLLRLDAIEEKIDILKAPPAPPDDPPAPPQAPAAGLRLGSEAPAFELPDLTGKRHKLADFRGRSLLLIFFNPQCGFCTSMADALAKFDPEGAEGLPMPLLVSTGAVEDNRAMLASHGLKCRLLLQSQTEISGLYQAGGTPMGYLIDAEGRIASPLAAGSPPILALAAGRSTAEAAPVAPAPNLPLGSAAPAFELPDLEGNLHSLHEFRGQSLLLIFFNPHCGHCTAMSESLAELPDWGNEGFALPLLVSTGSVDDNQALVDDYGLRCPLIVQLQMEVASQYQCAGTPMGYLIDGQGKIASAKAVGAAALLALARPSSQPMAVRNGQAPPATAAEKNGKIGHKPCGKCSEKDKAAGLKSHGAQALGQSYDLVDLVGIGSADAMVEALVHRSQNSQRLVVLLGAAGSDAMGNAQASALRRFLRKSSDWLVSFQPADAGRFLVLSRNPNDRKVLPSLSSKVANFGKALSLHIADGARKVTADEMERRLDICTLCDRRTGDHCSACGCDLPTKVGWRTTNCPLNKWPALAGQLAATAPTGSHETETGID